MDFPKSTETPESQLHFLDYWRIIRVRKTVILTVFLLVLITTTVVTFYLPEAFASCVRMQVERDETDVPGIANTPSYKSYDPFFLRTEFMRLQSQSVLDPVITNVVPPLTVRWADNPESPLRLDQARMILKNRMQVKEARNTSLIEVWVYSPDKLEAAEIANEIAKVYRDVRLDTRKRGKNEAIATFERQLALKDKDIKEKEVLVNTLRETNNISDLVDGSSASGAQVLIKETLRQLEKDRVDAQTQYIDAKTLLEEIKPLKPMEMRNSLPTISPDPQLSSLLESLAIAESKLAGLYLGESNAQTISARAVYAKTEEQVNEKIKGIVVGLEKKVHSYSNRLDEIAKQVTRARQEDISLSAKYRPYFNAKAELEELHRVRDVINLRWEQEKLDLKLPTYAIVDVIDRAEPALKPVRPDKLLNITLGVIVGLVVGVGLAFFIEYLDTSVKTIDDVERALQAPVLGVIPQNVGSLMEEGPDSPHAEAYRVLRTNILFSRKDEKWNTLSIVSGGAGEGKSTTLFNLATVFAQNGSRVLVVDSDLRRPSIHKILHVSNSVGLTNYLLKQSELEQVIQTTSLSTLDFLPSGKLPSSSMGVLSSVQMKQLISELKRRYDFVFFDSPPIMGVSDASILASEVDMVLQVIQYRRYPQVMTLRAKQMIQNVGGNLLGLVLNNINMSSDENYYYYSGYYQDYYSKEGEEPDVKKNGSKKSTAEPSRIDLKSKY